MDEPRTIGVALLAAILVAAVAGWWAGPETIFGGTPLGVAIYLTVGIGIPQLLLGRCHGDPVRLGVAALAIAGAGAAIVGGLPTVGATGSWPASITAILAIAVVGVLLGSVVREFRRGYRSSRRERHA